MLGLSFLGSERGSGNDDQTRRGSARDRRDPRTGYARIIDDDPDGPLWVHLGPLGHVRFALTSMLQGGWRVVEATPDERALLAAFGIAIQP